MSSLSRFTEARRRLRNRKAGRKRKNKLAERSTLTQEELFAGCGEPGQPAPGLAAPGLAAKQS
ncbi:MAG: hypothetical protein KC503_35015 [Myxococcales bacterium]|nr:hypothetical protein [Myxococcales bacterium]